MQRTDVLTQQEADKLNQANQQLLQAAQNPLSSRLVRCKQNTPKGKDRVACIQKAVRAIRADFAPVLKAYQHAARSVSGDCSQGLQAITDSLGDVQAGLGDMLEASGRQNSNSFQKAQQTISKALQNLIRIQDVKDCSVQKT